MTLSLLLPDLCLPHARVGLRAMSYIPQSLAGVSGLRFFCSLELVLAKLNSRPSGFEEVVLLLAPSCRAQLCDAAQTRDLTAWLVTGVIRKRPLLQQAHLTEGLCFLSFVMCVFLAI